MIEQERKHETIELRTKLPESTTPRRKMTLFSIDFEMPEITYPLKFIFSSSFLLLILALVIFILLINIPIFSSPEQQNCLAILVFASILWAFELLPLFVTAMLIPFFVVTLRVLRQ